MYSRPGSKAGEYGTATWVRRRHVRRKIPSTACTWSSSTPIRRLVLPVRKKEPVVLTFVKRCSAATSASVSAGVSSSWTMAITSFIGPLLTKPARARNASLHGGIAVPHGWRHDSRWLRPDNESAVLSPAALDCNLVRSDHIEQFTVQPTVGGEDLAVAGPKRPAAHVGHDSSGLSHNHSPGGDIPGREAPFPVSVEPTGGDVAEIEGAGPRLPYGLHASQEVSPDVGLLRAAREIVRKAGYENGCDEFVDGGNDYWRAIQGGAATFARHKQLIPHRVIDNADDGSSSVFEGNGDSERRQPMSEVGRTIERVDHPAVRRARRCSHTALFAEKIMLRTDCAKSVRDEILRGSVGFGYQIDSALEPHLMRLAEAVTKDIARIASDLRCLTGIFVQDKVHHFIGPFTSSLQRILIVESSPSAARRRSVGLAAIRTTRFTVPPGDTGVPCGSTVV